MFEGLDLNSQPVWLVAIAIILWLLPKIVKEFSAFIPPLAERLEALQERQNTILHHRLDSEAASQSQQVKIQDRLLSILEESLRKTWEDRELTGERLKGIESEIDDLRSALNHNTEVLRVHTATMSKLAEEAEMVGRTGAQIASIGAYLTGGSK
jgi:chromosome segregation ATPase